MADGTFIPDLPFGGNIVEPDVTFVSPVAGTTIGSGALITFDVTDDRDRLATACVVAKFDAIAIWELIHDGTDFSPTYTVGSSRTPITNGFRFIVRRAGGWPSTLKLDVLPVDKSGNVG